MWSDMHAEWLRSSFPPEGDAPLVIEEAPEPLQQPTKTPVEAPPVDRPQTGAATCGDYLPDVDLEGGDVPGYTFTPSAMACKDTCMGIEGCNAITWHASGHCYPKKLPEGHPATPKPGFTSYLVCPGDEEPQKTAEAPAAPPDVHPVTEDLSLIHISEPTRPY